MAKGKNKKSKKIRADGYENTFTNVGGNKDPLSYTTIAKATLLSQTALENILLGDGLGRRIVELLPQEAITGGFVLDGDNIDMPAIQSEMEDLLIEKKVADYLTWAQLYGGAAIVLGVSGRGTLDQDYDYTPGDTLDFIRVYDRYSLSRKEIDADPESETFGETIVWTVTPKGSQVSSYDVHHTRMIIDDGCTMTDTMKAANDGWGCSYLQAVVDALIDFGYSHKQVSSLLRRKQQLVWKAKNLADLCDDDDGYKASLRRLNLVDMAGSSNNTVAVDALDEDLTILNGDLAGVTDVLDKKLLVITAVTGIHQTILTGENVSGLNASSNSAQESFNRLTARFQKDRLKPVLKVMMQFFTSSDEWTVKFNPLSVPSPLDESAMILNFANASQILQSISGLSDEEIRATLKAKGWFMMTDKTVLPPVDNEDPNADLRDEKTNTGGDE